MAYLTSKVGKIYAGDTSVVDTSIKHQIGTRALDPDGNEYIYLQGVASTAAGDWVSFDEAGVTTRLVENGLGRVGIAMAAIVASSYGWYQIFGVNEIAKGRSGGIADNSCLYTYSTNAGQAEDSTGDSSGEMIIGAFSRSTDTSGVFTAELRYPMVINAAID